MEVEMVSFIFGWVMIVASSMYEMHMFWKHDFTIINEIDFLKHDFRFSSRVCMTVYNLVCVTIISVLGFAMTMRDGA